jgi:hypothetical protein
MAHYSFEVENIGQFDRVLSALKLLDSGLVIKSKEEINPYESNFRARILIDANYEDVLRTISNTKNSEKVLDTIRPIH